MVPKLQGLEGSHCNFLRLLFDLLLRLPLTWRERYGGKFHSRPKTALGGDQAAWSEPPDFISGGSYQAAYFSAWLAGNANSEQKIISNCCPFK